MAASPALLPLYEGLCASRREIRLLTLHPPHPSSSQICASLSVVSLSDNPYYEALSYVWGPRNSQEPTISLSGHNITVTKNLFAALHALRDNEKTKILWIDALCINQNDGVEKAYQVELMQDIYYSCSSCWIWLGEARSNNETRVAIMLIENWASDEHLNINVNFNSDCIQIATELATRDWFSRIWTVQESILPNNLVLICGSYRIPWTVFAKAAKSVQKHLSLPCCISHNDTANAYMKHVNEFLNAVLTIERSRKLRSSNSEILTCLHHYRNRQATKAQDKIFGLRSLLDSNSQTLIKIDYEKKVEDVYSSLCIEYIKKTRSLEILKYALWSTEKSKIDAILPSWVPDWTVDIPEPRWQKGRLDRYSLYDACGGQPSQPEFITVSGRYAMKDKGVCCGVVMSLGSERPAKWKSASEEAEEVDSGSKRNKKRKESKRRKKSEGNGQSIPKDWVGLEKLSRFKEEGKTRAAFWRTILMDTIRDSVDRKGNSLQRAGPAGYKEYEGLLTLVTSGTGWPVDTDRIYAALETATLLRRFFVTKDGHFGIGPAGMEEKDEIYVMKGGCCPLVLRPLTETGRYRFIGDCFLDGYMDGEAMVGFDHGAARVVCIE